MCVICLDYKRGAISQREALINLAEMIAVAAEDDDELFHHLEKVEQDLLAEDFLDDNRETD